VAEPTHPRPLPPEALGVEKIVHEHQTVNHARDWLALSMLGTEAQGAGERFLGREK